MTQEFRSLIQKKLLLMFLGMVGLFLLGAFVNLHLETEIREATWMITERFGFFGLALLLFCSDSLISPIPPELILMIVAKGPLAENWVPYVGVLGILSATGGVLGWWIGRRLGHLRFVNRVIGKFRQQNEDSIRRFGFWFVALGALTPLPFSITCWTAGALDVPLRPLVYAALLRVPRIFGGYLLIYYSDVFSRFF